MTQFQYSVASSDSTAAAAAETANNDLALKQKTANTNLTTQLNSDDTSLIHEQSLADNEEATKASSAAETESTTDGDASAILSVQGTTADLQEAKTNTAVSVTFNIDLAEAARIYTSTAEAAAIVLTTAKGNALRANYINGTTSNMGRRSTVHPEPSSVQYALQSLAVCLHHFRFVERC